MGLGQPGPSLLPLRLARWAPTSQAFTCLALTNASMKLYHPLDHGEGQWRPVRAEQHQ
jgi:hypothetical protein